MLRPANRPDPVARRRRNLAAAIGLAVTACGVAPSFAQSASEAGAWVVACDNADRCASLNVRAATTGPAEPSRVCFYRDPSQGEAPTIHLTLADPVAARANGATRASRFLRIAGPAQTTRPFPLVERAAQRWEVPAAFVPAVISELLDGGEAELLDAGGRVLERLAMEGIDEALRMVEETTARSAGTDRPAAPESVVTAPLPRVGAATMPSPAVLDLRRATCGAARGDPLVGYRLIGDASSPDRTLWVTACAAADGRPRALFVVETRDGSATAMDFDRRDGGDPASGAGLVDFPEFEPGRGLLRETWHAPARAATGGACIVERLRGWTGRSFELIQERRSFACADSRAFWLAITYQRPHATPATHAFPAAAAFATPCERTSR